MKWLAPTVAAATVAAALLVAGIGFRTRHSASPPPSYRSRAVAAAARPTAASRVPGGSGRHLAQRVVRRRQDRRRVVHHAAVPAPTVPTYLVLFVLDGARPDYFTVPDIPHVRALMRNGTQYSNAFAGILESETPSGHATIATGSEPRRDGILSFSWAASDNLPVNLFDPTLIRHGDLERIVSGSRVPTIAGLVHAMNRSSRVVALSGHKYYAADAIGGPDADVIEYYATTPAHRYAPLAMPGHMPPQSVLSDPSLSYPTNHLAPGVEDHLVMKLDLATFARLHQKVTLMNVPEFDWPLGHVDGGSRDPGLVRTLMQGFDRDLGQLEDAYRRAGVLNRTLFVITADHGFTPVMHTLDSHAIQAAVAAAHTAVVSDTFHTAGYIWIKDLAKAPAAAENIARLQNPYIQGVYFKESIPGGYNYVRASGPDLFRVPGMEAAYQYLLNTFAGPNGPDVVTFFTEEAGSEPGGQASWKGDHGGGDWEAQHVPLIFSGPGVRRGYVSSAPARLIDVAPTALSLMHIPVSGMQGIALADSMRSAPRGSLAAQRATAAALDPVVTALQQESRADIAAGR